MAEPRQLGRERQKPSLASERQVRVRLTAPIKRFNDEFGEAIYYLFYNPPDLPTTVHYPVAEVRQVTDPPLGCRVYLAEEVDAVVDVLSDGKSPTIGQIQSEPVTSNWRLETWVADLLLRCKAGQLIGDSKKEALVSRLIERRSGPIGAAIAVSIALPDG